MKKLIGDPFIKHYKRVKPLLKLKDRYFQMFEFRNGLADGVQHTLRETGEKFGGITGNRVSQMEARVIFEVGKVAMIPTPFD